MAGLTGYSLIGFLLLDWLGGVLWATSFAVVGRAFGQGLLMEMSDRAIWVLNIAPIMLIIIVRLIKRGIRGPAEEVLLSSPESGSPGEPEHHVKESIV
jgi:membrane protein DedA with SNARE-associated domain